MSTLAALSSDAANFPNVEVAYEDLLPLRYRADGRGTDGSIDCIGIVLEIYKRAGLGLPDPRKAGNTVFDFSSLFDKITSPDLLYDLANIRRESNHIMVIVRYGLALSATEKVGVYTRRSNILKLHSGVEFFRLKPSVLPV